MQIHHGHLTQMQPLAEPVALTIGNFDGVHLGHQYLIRQLMDQSRKRGVPAAVLCFDPHPDQVFATAGFQCLTTVEQKAQLLKDLGVQHLVLQRFDDSFAMVTAEDFLRQYLDRFFQLSSLKIGYDFRFGHRGEGDFSLIQRYFAGKDCWVEQAESFTHQGFALSSTLIRGWLQEGRVEQAQQALGRYYSLQGIVVKGQQLGRQLGFPTANLEKIETLVPGRGVYHCRVKRGPTSWTAVVNIGQRPTVQGKSETVEAHLLDFSEDLYGQSLEVHFVAKIRDEKKFANLAMLKEQIAKDIKTVRGEAKDG